MLPPVIWIPDLEPLSTKTIYFLPCLILAVSVSIFDVFQENIFIKVLSKPIDNILWYFLVSWFLRPIVLSHLWGAFDLLHYGQSFINCWVCFRKLYDPKYWKDSKNHLILNAIAGLDNCAQPLRRARFFGRAHFALIKNLKNLSLQIYIRIGKKVTKLWWIPNTIANTSVIAIFCCPYI